MDINSRTLQGVHVLKLKGKLHLGEPVDHLKATFDQLIGAGENQVVLNLSDVPLLDSSGIGLLVKTLTTIKKSGGDIRLVNPSKFTVQTLRMIGVLNLFQIFEDESGAVESFG